ncbi:co-chaperone DjlA [Granulosicoccus antarcticus]|uniref:Co-chaperone protein DjlA n=1 Tax=Granulosicoccus antarcticus IMCC3135 TaxID=1192854 RepID=A0A2Z2P3V9_9GAMM|nr:co-chaperone DjlA [Granulosicoccus antarcticus]ASJ74514.1 Co-chaperone protein DjlA [Granulosicoccus antarcticus IMCC3135]
MVWGKLLGGTFGFMIGGPLGAVLGTALGHTFDKGMKLQLSHDVADEDLAPGEAGRIKMAFFTATFSVMGYIAKADGIVDKSEIALAEALMSSMNLDDELRAAAIKLFNEGKQEGFDAEALVLQFREECQQQTSLYRMFVEILIQAALADGVMTSDEEVALLKVAGILGFSEYSFRQLEMLVRFSMGADQSGGTGRGYGAGVGSGTGSGPKPGAGGGRRRTAPEASGQMTLREAFVVLGVESSDDRSTVKQAYRRLMSQHHPDKLVSKGLPDEMIKLATDKTQHIQKAYEKIKESKNW